MLPKQIFRILIERRLLHSATKSSMRTYGLTNGRIFGMRVAVGALLRDNVLEWRDEQGSWIPKG